ncbi:unnamed protein product [Rotaria sp. Silwood2]|nr:unnamed protein product [Rotaria sp. Silwood2]CAF3200667.1 unnamed protein product [Rotaria sp. Silwood2]CAF3238504.1 unnamed protein product [Rotaria sp. Silwood2]CAF3412092.1 unnamed protein product [Rotaria sp. Silwood2]CAF4153442.1 unnamed protein product [Rotaria sp. Silwood2]
MSSSESNSVALLNNLILQINRYCAIFILLFGSIGNVLNILVLSQRNLRSNPCIWYFLISSIVNLISIIFGLSTRLLSGWNKDLTETIDWLCKLRVFVVFCSRTIAFWLIMFATIDRWLLSSVNVHFRQLSKLKNSQRITFIVVLISCLIHIEMFYCYKANLLNTPLKCYGRTELCRHLNDLIYACITILLPIIFMLIFGLWTISNIHKTQRRIRVENNEIRHNIRRNEQLLKKKRNRSLLKMLLVEVILLILLIFPQAIQKLHATITIYENKSQYHQAIDNFSYNCVLLLTFIASGIPFYIYTLCGGHVFRKALFNIFKCRP